MNRRSFIKDTSVIIGLGALNVITRGFAQTYDFDLIIKNGLIIDGDGGDGYRADLGLRGDLIAAIGTLREKSAYRTIDAEGLVVAPGFIDIHSHSEDTLLVNPRAESKIRQGVTTEIVGQDGLSVAPLTAEMQSELNERYLSSNGLRVDWSDFQGYFQRLVQTGIGINVGTMVGQGTLRECVIGRDDRPASYADYDRMKQLARISFQQGALGISSGLEYTPGAFASSDELIELCQVMDSFTGLYATHMRSEDNYLLEALDEAIAVARGANVALHIAHLKCMGERNWRKLSDVFEKIAEARRRGVSITFDRYPYTAYNSSLSSLLPVWAREGDIKKMTERLNHSEERTKIRKETLQKIEMIGSWEAVLISSVELEKNRRLLGKRVSEIVGDNGVDPFDFVCKLILEESNGVGICGFAMSEENTARILAHPLCMVASDAAARAPYGALNHSNPHPRTYGTFPRVLGKYVREDYLLSLPAAIRKMTAMPANRLGLKKRGRIAPDFFADLIIFDSAKIRDTATYTNPHSYPEGIAYVLVNGKVVVEANEHTGKLPGMILGHELFKQNY